MFDRIGKDLTAGSNDKQANGEDSGANGASDPEAVTKAVEEMAKVPKNTIYCLTCGMDCTRVRWHNARSSSAAGSASSKGKYDLCPKCFIQNRIPAGHGAPDFVRLEDPNYTNVPDRDAPWSESEMLLLLEGLEMFDENWTSIAAHVGTRTREECVLRFLQLEIEDKYLEDGVDSDPYVALNTGRLPFDQADNPVMSVVSFLAGMNGANVSAALAERTVKEVARSQRDQLENGTSGRAYQEQSPAKEKAGVKNEDTMDVDTATSPQPTANNQVAITEPEPSAREPSANLSAIALASSAARAAGLASHEEREMTRLVAAAVNITLQKFELKLAQFSEMESVLQAERQELERGRQQLFLDRLAFKKRVREVQEGLRKMGVRGENLGEVGEHKLSMFSVTGRAEEDIRPLGVGDEGYRNLEV